MIELAPNRGRLAVAAEIARLSFVVAGSALIALIFWLLTVAAAGRRAIPLMMTFGLLAVLCVIATATGIAGVVQAVRDMGRVRRDAEG